MKWVFRIIGNTIAGIIAMILFNVIGGFFGLGVALNIVNALIVGLLGLPGFALVLILQVLAQ